jgi:hypothetical protein
LERRLDDLEKIPCYNDLDNVISQKEITSAISTLYDSLSSPRDWKWDNHLDGATAEL